MQIWARDCRQDHNLVMANLSFVLQDCSVGPYPMNLRYLVHVRNDVIVVPDPVDHMIQEGLSVSRLHRVAVTARQLVIGQRLLYPD